MAILIGTVSPRPLPLARSAPRWTEDYCAGERWNVGILNTGGDAASLAKDRGAQEGVTATVGWPKEAGCALSFSTVQGEPTVSIERDPFGIHSILAVERLDGICEYHSAAGLSAKGKSFDEDALHAYLCFSWVPHPLTAWKNIRIAAPPADLPDVNLAAADAPRGSEGDEEAEETLLLLLRAAVRKRLTPDVGVAIYLSGGLDSSLVAALLVDAGVRPHAFTLDFGPPFDAEVPIARRVAEHLKIPLTVVTARPSQVAQALEATAAALPQPFGDAVTVPLYLLGQAAQNHAEEVWNGEGGDQLFGGWANKPMIAAHLYGLPDSEEAKSDGAGDATGRAADEVTEYLATFHRFWRMTDALYSAEHRERGGRTDPAEWVRPALDAKRHPALLHRLRAANLRLKGAQNIAPRMTALAECHGLCVRSPFFDTDLAAWTFTLPPERLLAGAKEKFLLKKVAERFLPGDVVWREKRGMGVPASEWCLSWHPSNWPLRRLLAYYLSPGRLKKEGRFDPAFVRRLLGGEDPTPEGAFRRRRVGEKLWLLLQWEAWREAHGAPG